MEQETVAPKPRTAEMPRSILQRPLNLVMIAVLASACSAPPQPAEPPVAAVQQFLAAVQRGDCDRAWTFFSRSTQAYIEERSRAMVEREPYYAETFAPRRLYCKPTSVHRFGSYVPSTARLASSSGKRATVTIERHEGAGFLLPGFWPTTTKITAEKIDLVEAEGAWKIVLRQEELIR